MKKLKIVFMGTPEFAVPSLEILAQAGYDVVGVVTAPDKVAGRGLKVQPSAVKEAATRLNIPILQPEKLKANDFLEALKALEANLQVVVAFRMLPEIVWAMPALGTFNLHASLLPNYRGAAPINWAVMNGEKQTGVTTFFLQQEIDTGDLIFQETEPITDTDTAGSLYERLMRKGAALVLKTVQAIENENYPQKPQKNNPNAPQAPKIFTETCQINFAQSTEQVRNFVRGLAPYPTAWTTINGKFFKIHQVSAAENTADLPAGNYTTDHKKYLHIATKDGFVAVDELQAEGKKRMKIDEFLRGNKLI